MASDLQRSPTRPVQQNHADSNDFCDLISPETPSVVSSRIMQARANGYLLPASEVAIGGSLLKSMTCEDSARIIVICCIIVMKKGLKIRLSDVETRENALINANKC
jgi:hypothetical protein